MEPKISKERIRQIHSASEEELLRISDLDVEKRLKYLEFKVAALYSHNDIFCDHCIAANELVEKFGKDLSKCS